MRTLWIGPVWLALDCAGWHGFGAECRRIGTGTCTVVSLGLASVAIGWIKL